MGIDVDATTKALLEDHGFDEALFERLRKRLHGGQDATVDNAIKGEVTAPAESDVRPLPAADSAEYARLRALGDAAIARGEVGCLFLAGGMATRFGGVVKASVPVIDDASFLDLKLADVHQAAKRNGGRVPVYLMASFATEKDVRALGERAATTEVPVFTFSQFISLRLTPDGSLFRDAQGDVSLYAPGHGDLTFAMRKSGLLRTFREGGGKYLLMSNVDNIAATLDPAVIGAHIDAGKDISVEVVKKDPGDQGGAPARVDGKVQIVEAFRFPIDFDQAQIPVFNTNTLVMNADAIDRDFELTWFAVNKKVDGEEVVQFEHLVGELTAFIDSTYLLVDRRGNDSRFLPVKEPEDLERQRGTIRELLQHRGVLPTK